MLLVLLLIIYINRRKRVRVASEDLLSLISYFCWFSTPYWAEYNMDLTEEKVIAILP
jgi:hypothetical protein